MKWYENSYCRMLIDNHITDQRPEYMSRFSSEEYARMVKLAGVDTAMVYACDHNGNCYYPTKVGHNHACLHGKDIFGETVRKIHELGVHVVAYYTVLYHNDGVRRFPESTQIDIQGKDFQRRYLVSCPNCESVVEFYMKQIDEILSYPVEGIFIDMSFWALFCYCDNCRRRFREMYGKELPTVINWDDPTWRQFIEFRERTMAEFAMRLTEHVRAKRPDISVTHQFSGIVSLDRAQTGRFMPAIDYCSGDFYGDRNMVRLGHKIFDAYTPNKPFEFMTSRCVDLHDHTSTKHFDELLLHTLTTLAHGGAYYLIDAINPDGTLLESYYHTLSKLNDTLTPFREAVKRLTPSLQGKVAIYHSTALFADNAMKGAPMSEYRAQMIMARETAGPLEEATGITSMLVRMHVPFRVVTETSADWSDFQCVIIPGAAALSEAECAAAREFVRMGGTLIVTGRTSLLEGKFNLGDVMGVTYTGTDSPNVCYLNEAGSYVFANRPAPYVTASPESTVRAHLAIPNDPPGDRYHYASIHSDPPGQELEAPAWTEHRFGKGLCVYLAPNVLGIKRDAHIAFGMHFLGEYIPQTVGCSTSNEAVEITQMRGNGGELIISAVNYQTDYPILDIADFQVTVTLPDGFRPTTVTRVSDGVKESPRLAPDGRLELSVSRLHYGEMWVVTPEARS